MNSFRFDVMQLNGRWMIVTGSANQKSYPLESEAVDAAVADAHAREAGGAQVTVFLWAGRSCTQIYGSRDAAHPLP